MAVLSAIMQSMWRMGKNANTVHLKVISFLAVPGNFSAKHFPTSSQHVESVRTKSVTV